MRRKRYFNTYDEFVQFKNRIKLACCPHCGKIGFLILHGRLSGRCIDAEGNEHRRGHRFLCSNRYRRSGCGKTFSILFSYAIKYQGAHTSCLWAFLSSLLQGLPKNTVFKKSGFPFTVRCAYRWLDLLAKYHYVIRSNLLKEAPPPYVKKQNPLLQLVAHFKKVFTDPVCPVSAYHNHFQTSVFKQ